MRTPFISNHEINLIHETDLSNFKLNLIEAGGNILKIVLTTLLSTFKQLTVVETVRLLPDVLALTILYLCLLRQSDTEATEGFTKGHRRWGPLAFPRFNSVWFISVQLFASV